ncbi:MAG: ABC transporter permease [Elusimicrobia bacterium]|nr:ABC transporter permease [Elusimicrobiota bacterium]
MSEYLRERYYEIVETLGEVAIMVADLFKSILRYRVDLELFFAQASRIGVDSLPVVSITSIFVGMVLALQTGYSFQNVFNEPLYVGTVVGFSILKELGPVFTAIVVAGRIGASIAAELGTMKVTEQIDALYTLGTNPVRYLGVPRFLAAFLMLPILTIYADGIGIFGGYLVATAKLGIPASTYWNDILNNIDIDVVVHGVLKSFAFAAIVATTACYVGFKTSGGAEGVGQATTQAVVVSMVAILISDYFLSAILVAFGIG